jgi:glycosyltransferase involved in cell wall biosynthesis
MTDKVPDISIVVPVYNEQDNLRPLTHRLLRVLESLDLFVEVIFIDDGSQDASLDHIRSLCREHSDFRALVFSRNFGKEVAIAAGLDTARGRAVVIMDSDLQHPPELIEKFIEKWRLGYKNVYGQRTDRSTGI